MNNDTYLVTDEKRATARVPCLVILLILVLVCAISAATWQRTRALFTLPTWQFYREPRGIFTVRYPLSAELRSSTTNGKTSVYIRMIEHSVEIDTWPNPQGLSAEEFLQDLSRKYNMPSRCCYEYVDVSGTRALQYLNDYANLPTAIIPAKGHMVTVHLFTACAMGDCSEPTFWDLEDYRQILSTLVPSR